MSFVFPIGLSMQTSAQAGYLLLTLTPNYLRADEVLDLLLDQEGLEVDPLDRLDRETPLHKAVRFANELPPQDWEVAKMFVELLLDAGADPRLVLSSEFAA